MEMSLRPNNIVALFLCILFAEVRKMEHLRYELAVHFVDSLPFLSLPDNNIALLQ